MKVFIVTAHAHFRTPSEIKAALRDEFGVEVEATQVLRYNPTKLSFEGKAEYRDLFDQARAAYITDVSSVPIANQGWRLNELMDNYQAAKKSGNRVLAAALLEQAAKEVGGALTNERVHRSSGAPMQPDVMSPEERRAAALGLFAEALAARAVVVHEGVATQQ